MKTSIAQLILRLSIAMSFLSAVADRLGYWGEPGELNVSWGNWENFLAYSNSLNSFLPVSFGAVLAIMATVFEVVFAILLLLGIKTKQIALLSGLLLMSFAIAMTVSIGVKAPFDYSVWIGSSACFLLCTLPHYAYSVDSLVCVIRIRDKKS